MIVDKGPWNITTNMELQSDEYVMRSKGWLMKGIMESPFVQAWANLIFIRGRYAVRPFMM